MYKELSFPHKKTLFKSDENHDALKDKTKIRQNKNETKKAKQNNN